MKHVDVYICEKCGFESTNPNTLLEHEAKHLGLTIDEKESYDALNSFILYMEGVLSTKYNDEAKKVYDEAVEKLAKFKLTHSINK